MSDFHFTPGELAAWSSGRWCGGTPPAITGFAIDSRAIQPGDCFVALPGAKVDGHQFLDVARERGAACALVRGGVSCPGLPLLEVADPKHALMELARGHRARLGGRMIAVTGSSGKTSVKEMTADLLALAGPTARTRGNWNNDLGLPLSLLTMKPGDAFGVFEVGMNHPGELKPLCELLRPHISVVTCVGPVHIEFFESEEGIAHEKAEVYRALDADGLAILPADDPWFRVLNSHVRSRALTVSMQQDADYRVVAGEPPLFVVSEWASGETSAFSAPLPGRHVLSNAGLAIAVARQFGIEWEALARRVQAFRPPGMRWEDREVRGVRIINDAYNANPMSMRAALDAFAEIDVAGNRWLVLGAMRELGTHAEEEHLALGRLLARGPWAGLVAVGPEGAWLREGARSVGFQKIRLAADAMEAARILKDLIQPGDAVLLKASRGVALEDVLDELG
ncbi:MAG TPA: UDP-N-acetylmuramoyl-tripeptide--D-alanyl-D-alanine ligase [Kiritimatiellia bacterium]|nr:UDP-N-acetylmuramoyl-tripeptide--D-alanyl-D-alanine ligase [Kiritimatiellia bacterium]